MEVIPALHHQETLFGSFSCRFEAGLEIGLDETRQKMSVTVYRDVSSVVCLISKLSFEVGLLVAFLTGIYSVVLGLSQGCQGSMVSGTCHRILGSTKYQKKGKNLRAILRVRDISHPSPGSRTNDPTGTCNSTRQRGKQKRSRSIRSPSGATNLLADIQIREVDVPHSTQFPTPRVLDLDTSNESYLEGGGCGYGCGQKSDSDS